jgi:uncharacterized protein YwgA
MEPVMNRYALGKVVELAGSLSSRKRIQKIVHLLRAAGCPVDASYRLHYYGPYSDDVASVLNQLVQSDLLIETELPTGGSGRQFKYRLSESGARSLQEFEKTPEGQAASEQIAPHNSLLRKLLQTELTQLELASTIVFNRQAGSDWDDAIDETFSFKQVERAAPALAAAVEIARSIVD